MSAVRARFHLAFPVDDLEAARAFYAGVLGCETGRESSRWMRSLAVTVPPGLLILMTMRVRRDA